LHAVVVVAVVDIDSVVDIIVDIVVVVADMCGVVSVVVV
jgi:hypothetical protein